MTLIPSKVNQGAAGTQAWPISFTPPTLTKGTQGANGYSVQDLKDAGRQAVHISWNAIAGTAAVESTLTNFTTGNRAGTALTAATNYTVSSGKTLRIQEIHVFLKSTSTAVNIATYSLRQAPSAIANTSPVIWQSWLGIEAATAAVNTSVAECYPIPDGLEIAAGQQLTMTFITGANTCTVSYGFTGYEY